LCGTTLTLRFVNSDNVESSPDFDVATVVRGSSVRGWSIQERVPRYLGRDDCNPQIYIDPLHDGVRLGATATVSSKKSSSKQQVPCYTRRLNPFGIWSDIGITAQHSVTMRILNQSTSSLPCGFPPFSLCLPIALLRLPFPHCPVSTDKSRFVNL